MSFFGKPLSALDWNRGACDLFALAMNRVTGLPMHALIETAEKDGSRALVHAFCLIDSETMVDAVGFAPAMKAEDAVGTLYPGETSSFSVIPVSEKDLLELRNHECDYDWEIEHSGIGEFLNTEILPQLKGKIAPEFRQHIQQH
jgi:hypothetical protein